MIKTFKIFEKSLYSSLKKVDDIEDDGKYNYTWSDYTYEKKEEYLKKVLAIDKIEYGITFPTYSDFSLHFKNSDFKELVNENIDDNIFSWCQNVISTYGDYDYEVDQDEIYYLQNYMNDKNKKTLKRIGELLDIKVDFDKHQDGPSPGNLIYALGDYIDYQEFQWEISYERESAVKQNVEEELEKLPFDITYSNKGNYDIEVEIKLDRLGEYLEKRNEELGELAKRDKIKTFEDLVKSVDFSGFEYSSLENAYETDYEYSWDDLEKSIQNQFDEVLDILEDIEPETEYKDPKQLSLFQDVDDELLKKALKHQPKRYHFDYDFFSKINIDKISDAKKVGGKILGWFKSYEFQHNYITNDDFGKNQLEKYRFLIEKDIIHPVIEDEFEYLEGAKKFNL